MSARWQKVVVIWSWQKPSDTRSPVTAEIRVEERTGGENVLTIDLTADDVTRLLSGSALRVDAQVAAADPRQIEGLLSKFVDAYEEYDGQDVGALVLEWAERIARQVP